MIDKQIEFKEVRISFQGFSIFKRISINYGGQEPSNICFNFSD